MARSNDPTRGNNGDNQLHRRPSTQEEYTPRSPCCPGEPRQAREAAIELREVQGHVEAVRVSETISAPIHVRRNALPEERVLTFGWR